MSVVHILPILLQSNDISTGTVPDNPLLCILLIPIITVKAITTKQEWRQSRMTKSVATVYSQWMLPTHGATDNVTSGNERLRALLFINTVTKQGHLTKVCMTIYLYWREKC